MNQDNSFDKHLILVTQDNCPPCLKAKEILTERDISYREVKRSSTDFNELDMQFNISRFPTLIASTNLSTSNDPSPRSKPREVEFV